MASDPGDSGGPPASGTLMDFVSVSPFRATQPIVGMVITRLRAARAVHVDKGVGAC